MSKLNYLIIPLVIVTMWFQRHIFFDYYDANYIQDYYSLSQWSFTNSSRIMGDADLYSFAGYKLLASKFDPFLINPEAPIFAKLFFGSSILLFNNAHYASILFLIFLLYGVDKIAKSVFKFSRDKRALLVLLIFCSAEIQEQIRYTLLDLPQISLYIWHIIFLFNVKQQKLTAKKNILYSGILLGLMTATKIGLYTPIILLIDSWYLFKNNQIRLVPILFFTTVLGYLLPYTPIIVSDGLVNFIKAQKWIYHFYTSSKIKAPIGMIFITSFTGMIKGWTNLEWHHIYTWNGEWALGLTSLAISINRWLKSKKTITNELSLIILSVTSIIIILFKIPFWPRYMIFLIPFFWLLILNITKNKSYLILILIFPIISTSKLIVKSNMPPRDFIAYWNNGAYEELYNFTSNNFRKNNSRINFVKQNLLKYENLHPNKVNTKIIDELENKNKSLNQTLSIELTGYLGEKEIKKELIWIKENSQWKINEIKTVMEKAKHYNNLTNLICINPLKVSDWSRVYAEIEKYYNISYDETKNKIMQLVPRDYCIPIGKTDETKIVEMLDGIEILNYQ